MEVTAPVTGSLPVATAPIPTDLLPQRLPPTLSPVSIPISLLITLMLALFTIIHQNRRDKDIYCPPEEDMYGGKIDNEGEAMVETSGGDRPEPQIDQWGSPEGLHPGIPRSRRPDELPTSFAPLSPKNPHDHASQLGDFGMRDRQTAQSLGPRPQNGSQGPTFDPHHWEDAYAIWEKKNPDSAHARPSATNTEDSMSQTLTMREPSRFGGDVMRYSVVDTEVSEANDYHSTYY